MITLKTALEKLAKAQCPEDIFGKNKDDIVKIYRDFSKIVHEDSVEAKDKKVAHEAFIHLGEMYEKAKLKIQNNTYGKKTVLADAFSLVFNKQECKVTDFFKAGDISDLYSGKLGTQEVLIKITRNYANNDLVKNEAETLKYIHKEIPADLKILSFIPELIGHCAIRDGSVNRNVNLFKKQDGLISLQEILDAYPEGIDPRDMAWMFNRILSALIISHQAGIVHGAIVPSHILYNIENHSILLVDWCYSVKKDNPLKAIVSRYKNYYPEEVFVKKPANFGTDLYMAAVCALALLGGDINSRTFKISTPVSIKNLIKSCLLGYTHRVKNVEELYDDFNEILKSLYGKRKFRVFVMPDKTK